MDYKVSENPIEVFFNELRLLAEKYEELTDTDVREDLHLTLNYFFVWKKEDSSYPISYGMFSKEGDQFVATAVNNFLKAITDYPEIDNMPIGQERLDLLQNENMSLGGCQYDEFIGHTDSPLPPDPLPKWLFDEGDYDE
ncbi:conserved hypothetical protein [Bathymodiolus platifrons methanotrophic gill symbiont]|uniref:hypothetical protein n=1 Tax=Bathymodiolus platifrons methanotrophic gill symbiont TaxID=113268 RepID=UPI000B416C10|nr:hypothetical protein [Bathymodiolus platifrons methanotrophic gill symbiont]GAW85497.1 conserved hypothetical protein [Bathymodiolus platifrons methanotrophic gill symbiont]GFO77612.1 hypothetical protein BPLS_P6160 [Bathymodiolus platifrons methanotrophic gill symbiont]